MSAQESFGSFGALDSALEAPLGLQHDLESISQQPHTTTAASASQTQPLTPGPLSVQPRPSSSLSSSHLSRRNPREEKRDERQSHYQTLKQREQEDIDNLLKCVPEIKRNFEVINKIGEGTFSSVFVGSIKGFPQERYTLKHLVPTSSPVRLRNELKCLMEMGGRDNVIELHSCVRNRDHLVLLMPYFPHNKFSEYLSLLTVSETRDYMQALFVSLRNVHSYRYIHRDIKPSNFLYNRDKKEFRLVDFGLAHMEPGAAAAVEPKSGGRKLRGGGNAAESHSTRNGIVHIPPHTYQRQTHQRMVAKATKSRSRKGLGGPGEKGEKALGAGGALQDKDCHAPSNATSGREQVHVCPLRHKATDTCTYCMARSHQSAPRAGTPGFRPPEVLLKCPNQTTAVDVWSAGVMLLCILSQRYPFFKASDDLTALAQIITLMGSKRCIEAARNLGKDLIIHSEIKGHDLKKVCERLRASQLEDNDFIDLSPPRKKLRSHEEVKPTPIATPRRTNRRAATTTCIVQKTQAAAEDSVIGSLNAVPDSAYDLLFKCLDLNPATRITAEQALLHPFIVDQR